MYTIFVNKDSAFNVQTRTQLLRPLQDSAFMPNGYFVNSMLCKPSGLCKTGHVK